ncbi:hypothetical protein SD37_06040 [Amycolatopsis orientalis]|uniref:Uncharacterized protein n=1 Tax=Amycolatopsis orientalis TaxID=31958 RepID=A0A193BSR5_AMYOR|nr:hypothetical protein [Amycolatopsis orientalis]ANN15256.1 hypothetical protein SD37_06040 [Amycolatopsis orientalis]
MSQNQSSATAIGAAVLAFLCGMRCLSEAGAFGVQLALLEASPPYFVGAAWNGVLAVTLFVGGVLLLLRKPLGRVLIVAGTALALAVSVLANGEIQTYFFATVDGQPLVKDDVVAFMVFATAVSALVLSVIRPTSDWLEGKRREDEEPPKQDRLPGW